MRRALAVGVAILAVVLAWFLMRTSPPEAPDRPVAITRDAPRRTVGTTRTEAPSMPVAEAHEVAVEQDSPERLQYRAEMGAIADEVGLAVVECALRDPQTGGEVGRFIAFVDGVGHPDNGDARRKGEQSTEDDFDRTWVVKWDMPEDATHATCTAEPAEMFTLVVNPGETGVTRASCSGTLRMGPNERPVIRTPCELVAEGTAPIQVPKMQAGETFTVTLEVDDAPEEDEPKEELQGDAKVVQVLDQEDYVYETSAKWAGLVNGLKALRDRTPEGRIRDLLDGDLQDYGQSVEGWQVEEEKVSDKVDAVLEEVDGEL